MLNRPGFLFRRLISYSRTQVAGCDEDQIDFCNQDDSISVSRVVQKQNRSTSWISTPKKKKRGPAAPITLRRIRSVCQISSSLSTAPHDLPYSSSTSSFCSYDGHVGSVTRDASGNRKAASSLCLPKHGQTNEHSIPPTQLPRLPRDALVCLSEGGSPSDANSPKALLSLSPSIEGSDSSQHQPSPSQAVPDNESPERWSENVQQLILETDEAFKAVGLALAEAKDASKYCEDSDTSAPPPIIRRHSRSMTPSSSTHREQRPKDTLPPSPMASPARHASVKKQKKKKAAKKPLYGAVRQGKSQFRGPRWALSENVTDILTGQRFKRIEADEMLTPERIEQLKQTREKARMNEDRLKPRISNDSTCSLASDKTETPVEPFHLDDLPSRIGAAGIKTMITTIEANPPSVPANCDVSHRDFSALSGISKGDKLPNGSKAVLQPIALQDSSLPSLPAKNPARFSPKPHRKNMPSIPEVMVTTPDNTQLEPSTNTRSQEKQTLSPEENEEFLYLKSTPFTLTKPAFRHGPITFSKAEVGKGARTMDDTLDWTAFQMAILGGAGDFLHDASYDDDSKQADEVASWFESFGFETEGDLVREPLSSSRDSSQSTLSSTPSTVDTDSELPIPVGTEFPSGFWNRPTSAQTLDARKFFSSTGLKRWVVDVPKKRYTTQSSDSLPPSPMMPLVVHTGDLHGDDIQEAVPMGYNLGHDLGDFLKWEAEHVYAGGFYGSP
ncbi:hypothetical protein G7046_g2799 [Stylonectria norvegica]|nr:hypothetical protein G7046_g2799 [Stylonectria norvegica]